MSERLNKLLKILAAEPGDAFTLYGIAQEYSRQGEEGLERAVEYFDRCLAADPGYCYAYYHKAKVLADHGRTDDAVSVLRAGVSAARQAGDGKALSEISSLLDSLT